MCIHTVAVHTEHGAEVGFRLQSYTCIVGLHYKRNNAMRKYGTHTFTLPGILVLYIIAYCPYSLTVKPAFAL